MTTAHLPTVGVVIPTWNEADVILDCLRSVMVTEPCEVVVVDGGSSDDTTSLARQAGAVVLHTPRGRARQMNTGAAASRGDVLLFLHADCTLARGAIRRMRRILRTGRHQAGYFRQKIGGGHVLYRLSELGSNLRARWLRRPYGDQAMFFTRMLFERVGGFPDVPFMEDLYIARSIRPFGPLLPVPEAVCCSARRWQRDGIVRRILRNWSVAIAERCGQPPEVLASRYACCDVVSPSLHTPKTEPPVVRAPSKRIA